MRRSATAALLLCGLAFALPAQAQPFGAGPEARPGREASPGQLALRERQRKCGAEWRQAKAKGTTGGLKWPQYWSACNKRMKGESI